MSTPWEIAEKWYREEEIARAIQKSGDGDFGSWSAIPKDVHSPEFAKWLTHHYRLAMAKGVQLGHEGVEELEAQLEDAQREEAIRKAV